MNRAFDVNRAVKTCLHSQTMELIWKCPAAAALVLLGCLALPVQAQDDSTELVLPELPRISASSGGPAKSATPSKAQSDAATKKIQEALQGKPTTETGDGMLDDVLGVIRQRGSVLDGSALDPNFADGVQFAPAPPEQPATIMPNHDIRVAEQLLAAARILQASFPIQSATSGVTKPTDRLPVSVLVLQLRLRAVELLQRGLAVEQRKASAVIDVDSLLH